MKILFTCSFCWLAWSLLAQQTPLQLHEAAKTLLDKTPVEALDRLLALDQLKHSQLLLRDSTNTTPVLAQQNDSLIKDLQGYFSAFAATDSLLNSTRFFPDSVFQTDTRYSDDFKTLVQAYLSEKNKSLRKIFLNLRYLNTGRPNLTEGSKLNFEDYWPIEVLVFEDWLVQQENSVQKFPTAAANALLNSKLTQKLDSLKQAERIKTYEQNADRFQADLEELKTTQTTLENKNKQLKYIGLAIVLLLLGSGYFFWQKTTRLLESKNQSLLEEKRRSEDLLSNMLPSEVVRQLKNNRVVKAESYDNICILFTDFQGFSKISENLPPEELVRELDYCFTNFDRIIEKHHLQKIKTIGDAYMCVGGLYTRGNKHVQRMVAAALEIQEFLKHRSLQKDELGGYFFEARIGIHTGSVVAGVIGTQRIAFDVWGDSVNIAQQMEQHCEVRTVNISGATYELVKDHFDCSYRGEIQVKNGKCYGMYQVSESS
ncbi:MAG: adenylate/guanylate cyclase domain-containing protein [Bacteroidota bacterium]